MLLHFLITIRISEYLVTSLGDGELVKKPSNFGAGLHDSAYFHHGIRSLILNVWTDIVSLPSF